MTNKRIIYRGVAYWAAIAALACLALLMPQRAAADGGIIQFPDPQFKKALIANGVDRNNDGEISREEMAYRSASNGEGLGSLSLNNSGITDLTGIEHAVNLDSLIIKSNPLSSLKPLQGLPNLYFIEAGYTNISDLSPLASMPQIRLLFLEHTLITDLSPLASLSELQILSISKNNLTDLSPLAHTTKLSTLYANYNRFKDISALASLPRMTNLQLSFNQIEQLAPLANLTYLRELFLDDNNIADVSALSRLTELKQLDLYNNNIANVAPLSGLSQLEWLELSDNAVSDISALSRLVNLQELGLYNNNISDIRPLANLRSMKYLFLGSNSITDITPLAGMTSMYELMLSGQAISDITPLAGMKDIRFLYIENASVSDITPLRGLTRLRELHLTNNRISDLSPLLGMSELSTLLIEGNALKDVSPLQSLPGITTLRLEEALKDLLRPLPVDIIPGGQYNRDVVVRYNTGTVTINGSLVPNGAVLSQEGHYQMEIREIGSVVSTIYFAIDKTPPRITGVAPGGVYYDQVEIIFNEGSATLNDKPVNTSFWVDQFDGSNNHLLRVKEAGSYNLVVTDLAGNVTSLSFAVSIRDAIVRGISNDGVYRGERTITFNDATATLNGKVFASGGKVTVPGEYTLIVKGKNGQTETFKFRIQGDKTLLGVSKWATSEIAYAQSIGLTDPVDALSFSSLVTREKFGEIAVNLYEALIGEAVHATIVNPFHDTSNPEVVKAYQLGIVNGTSATTFAPDQLITREQLAAMLLRTIQKSGVSLQPGQKKTFSDRKQFSNYAVEAIDFLSSIDVINGVKEHEFGFGQNATVEQAVVMAKRIYTMASAANGQTGGEKPQQSDGSASSNEPATFGAGDMFAAYVKHVQTYLGVEGSTNQYALINEQSFILPAYSAIYLIAPINQHPPERNHHGELVVSNMTDKPKTIAAKSIDMSLEHIYRDKWGTVTSPDGATIDSKSTGPFIRLIVFDGPFDDTRPYNEYHSEGRLSDIGNWNIVRHK